MSLEPLYEGSPWVLAGLGAAALVFFAMLRVTQLGKYLWLGLGALGLLFAALATDYLVVTDRERIEGIVRDLASAVEASDADRVFAHLRFPSAEGGGPRQAFVFLREVANEAYVKALIRRELEAYRFDFVRVSDLRVRILPQSGRGEADFKVFFSATARNPGAGGRMGAGTANTPFRLVFREVEPKVWKVVEIDGASDLVERALSGRTPARAGD